MTKPVHLWWLWDTQQKDGKMSPAAALKETGRIYSLCGKKDLTKEEATVFPDDATCDICKQKAKAAA